MQVFTRVLVLLTFLGSGLIPFDSESYAQNTGVAPVYIDQAIYNAAQEGFICSQETLDKLDPSEREARIKVCGLDLEIDTELEEPNIESEEVASPADTEIQASTGEPEAQASTSESNSLVVNDEREEVSLLPNPEVDFVEDYVVKFDGDKDTIFLGGVVPFVAIPDTELATDDSFFNDDSFSVFFYLKRKF